MRIVSITQAPMDELGGMQTQARWLNGVLRDAGHSVEEIWPPLAPWQRHSALFALGGEAWQELKTRRLCAGLARRFDLAICHGAPPPPGLPALCVFHNSIEEYARQAYPAWHPNRWKLGLVNAGLERMHAATRGVNVAVSQTQAEGLRRLGIRVDRVIYNPIDPAIFHRGKGRHEARRACGWPDDAFVILGVGRPARGKGWERYSRLAARFAEAKFYCAGPSQVPPKYPNLCMLGRVERESLALHYQAADLLISLSVAEGFGLALGEAMACGTPYMATPTGLGGDLKREGGALAEGIVSRGPEGDESALERLMRSPELRLQISEAGARFIRERASPARIAGEYLALVEALAVDPTISGKPN